MVHGMFCVEHARHEHLVDATAVCDGRSVCPDHVEAARHLVPIASTEQSDQCQWCRPAHHRAYFVVDQLALCVRHTADAVFEEDDMGAHNMAHAAYLSLRAAGVTDAY